MVRIVRQSQKVTYIQGVQEKTAQSLMHRNFTIMSHRVVRTWPKMFKNYLIAQEWGKF